MLQRIQTLYLLAAFGLCLVCLCLPLADFLSQTSYESVRMYNLWLVSANGKHLFYWCPVLMSILVIAAAVVFIDIWLYSRRNLQMRVCTFSMILLICWYVALGIIVHTLRTDMEAVWLLRWTASLPAVSFILLWLARRGILKDEKLVRSLDRLR